MKDWIYWGYFLIGMTYWAINMYVRKLPQKNEDGEGWTLSLLWFLGWPICFIVLIINWLMNLRTKSY